MFEEDGVGDSYADTVIQEIKDSGLRLNIGYKKAAGRKSKNGRILSYEGEICEMYFIDYANSTMMYRDAMRNLTTYPVNGKAKHDDAPDGLAGGLELIFGSIVGTAEAMKRPF